MIVMAAHLGNRDVNIVFDIMLVDLVLIRVANTTTRRAR
jgi:hypothetical protein